jgi:hypothetical protein
MVRRERYRGDIWNDDQSSEFTASFLHLLLEEIVHQFDEVVTVGGHNRRIRFVSRLDYLLIGRVRWQFDFVQRENSMPREARGHSFNALINEESIGPHPSDSRPTAHDCTR